MNRCYFTGRLTAEPEFMHTPGGTAVFKFRFAVNRKFKREGEADADFFQCEAIGKTAENFARCNIRKGTKLLLTCEVRNNNYEKDGVKYYGTKLFVLEFEFMESKTSGTPAAFPAESSTVVDAGFEDISNSPDEDHPF